MKEKLGAPGANDLEQLQNESWLTTGSIVPSANGKTLADSQRHDKSACKITSRKSMGRSPLGSFFDAKTLGATKRTVIKTV